MRTMKKVIGILILFGVFAMLFGITCLSDGVLIAVIELGLTLALTALVVLAVNLICS